MAEERQVAHMLETWACGCKRWILEEIDDEGCLGDEQVERQEPCRELYDLYMRESEADLEEHVMLVEHGELTTRWTSSPMRLSRCVGRGSAGLRLLRKNNL